MPDFDVTVEGVELLDMKLRNAVSQLAPEKIEYLALAADRLGPLSESRIHQRGEQWRTVASPFEVMEHMQHLVSNELAK